MTSASTAPLRLAWSGQTDRGKVRPNNEDCFLGLAFDAVQAHLLGKTGEATFERMDYVFAVSDGMGGAHAGEFASKITIEQVTRLMPRGFRLRAQGLQMDYSGLFQELFARIHAALQLLGSSYAECVGMGATLSLAWFSPGWMHFAHLGDSRIYYLPKDGPLRQVSHDHTHVGWLHRQGKLSERELRTHPARNSLLRALGAGHQFIDPQIGAVACEPGDRFLLCSDGLVDGLWDRQLEELLRPAAAAQAGQSPAGLLVRESLERSGRDNTTALVVTLE